MQGPVLDIWTFYHFAGFAFIFSTLTAIKPNWSWKVFIIIMVSLGFGWEIAEHFLQRVYPDMWSNVVEHWVNAWITDICSDIFGGVVGVAGVKWWKEKFSKNG